MMVLKNFVAVVVPFLLGALAHKLLSEGRASRRRNEECEADVNPQRDEEDVNPQRGEEDVNPGTPSPPIPPSDYDYEVFLNFRGGDTRKSFADHLYRGLIGAGVRVFRDDVELGAGEEVSSGLRRAIEKSKISIPIISENYASSKWCLYQLVEMMKCKKQSGHMVLPIFYKVNPADVRRQRGSFGEAFRYHSESKRFGREVVEEWKQALGEVGSLRGWEVADGREGQLVVSVVEEVLKELNKAVELDISENLVGIDSDVDKVMELIDKSFGATVCVGIHGMVGIGKTTLVKAIYNKLSDQFAHHSFIADIRESCHRNGIVRLQNQLIFDILGRDAQVYDKDEGIKLMKSRFRAKKVLIILDDVDTTDQFNTLAGNTDWFAPGSRIFVTTRNESVLDCAGVVTRHELKEMNEEQSLVLFSRHAFRRDSPPNEFSALAHLVVSITGGLPLALEVVASYLCGKTAKVWRDAIEKMQNMPHKAVRDKLMVSYYELEEDQKQMFLDIACFLIGKEARVASYMWDACGFFARLGIEVLRSLSLIKIGDNHEFRMQSQLRDLGRDIVRAESNHKPHKRSRLWVYEEALKVLEREKVSEMIEAICLEKGNSTGFADKDNSDYQGRRKFTPEQFARLPNLRFLHMSDVSLTGDFKSLLSELRWLKWGNCPPNFVATNLQAKELVILDLSGSKISDGWKGWDSMMVAKQLKVLNLTGCRSLKGTSYLSAFKKLEILILRDCSELEGVDPHIGDMKNLVSLDLRGCLRLEELPPQMAKLERLEELLLDRTAIREIPSFISSLKKLKMLSAKDCEFLLELPDSVGSLVNLQCLSLGRCHKLRQIPDSIGMLKLLTRLDLSGCSGLEKLPAQMGELEQLKELLLDRTMIWEIPSSIGYLKKLEKLSAEDCDFLLGLPYSIGHLENLRCLSLGCCQQLRKIPDSTGKLRLLTLLNLRGCGRLEKLPPQMAELEQLEELHLDQTMIREIPSSIGSLKKLKTLSAKDCKFLLELPDSVGCLVNLQCLSLGRCHKLGQIPDSIGMLKLLTRLDMSGCSSLEKLPPQMGELEQLKELLLDRTMIREIPPSIGYLKKLEKLSAEDCDFLLGLPDSISDLVNLRCLSLGCCQQLRKIPDSIGKLRLLTLLNLRGCGRLEKLPPQIAELEQLEELHLDQTMIREIPSSIGSLKKLKTLSAKDCEFLLGLPDSVGCLVNLRCLSLGSCLKLRYIPDSIGKLRLLTRLDLRGCRCIVELPPQMAKLEQLEELHLDGTAIQEIPSCIGSLKKLETLSAKDCEFLLGLPYSIGHLENLSTLVLSGCVNLAVLTHSIGRLGNLSTLDLSGCVNLAELPDLICELGNLSTLVLSGCVNLAVLPHSIGRLGNLSTLDLSGCVNLAELPYSIGCLENLSTLVLSGCVNLAVLPLSIGRLGNLSTLDLSNCLRLREIPDLIGMLKSLTRLDISGMRIKELPESIGQLQNLKVLG